ncbi:IS6 family transposase [Erwinia endophytica]|uniref:IS6 family transposase n=1 Tax=Erwinia endophytica TaxID=1563158 RepID=UPI001265E222|nr:IS6 family transposase [Erwinia endophytica]KAB8310085.1 IS6 family transposase [Erwinia endophytica]
MSLIRKAFKRLHYPTDIIAQCVRWYLAYALSLRNLKIRSQWKYLYRAVDTSGQTINFLLTAKRDAAAALRFFRKDIRHHGEPEMVTIDKSGANTAALATLNAGDETITIRQSKYLNNLIEQASRNIKRRIRLMLGVKSFRRAPAILASIELIHMIRKGQYQHPAGDGMPPAGPFYLMAT